MSTTPTKRFLTGAAEIAAFLEIDVRAAFRALESNHIPGALKQGRIWRLDTRAYEAAFRNSVAA